MHYFANFKGFELAKINLFESFTVLIGPNGSGKSNVIEAIELLSFIAHGKPLHEIVDVGRGNGYLEIRGGLQSCPRRKKGVFALSFQALMKFERKKRPYQYDVFVAPIPKPQIVGEVLYFTDKDVKIFKTVDFPENQVSGDIRVEYNNFASGGRKPIANVSRNRSLLSQYFDFGRKGNRKFKECMGVVNGTLNYLQSSFVFDPNPKLMRTYERIGNKILTKDGANLSAVLYGLAIGNDEEKESLSRLLGWIKRLPDEPYNRFDFVNTELNDVIFGLEESTDNFFVDASLLSDGTLRCLAVLTALETVDRNSRVIIEEFDNGLHPSRIQIMLEAIDDCCKRRSLNVLVTTHNPATLNMLSDTQLDGVVLCAWNNEKESFELIKLVDLPRFDELLERGQLGDLVSKKVINNYLRPKFSEEYNSQALKWLRDLP
jgi:ABC-type branched-subunit amino acid transport system ATPase component